MRCTQVPGATVVEQHAEPHTLLGGCFFVSGGIPRQTPYEAGNPTNASQWVRGPTVSFSPLAWAPSLHRASPCLAWGKNCRRCVLGSAGASHSAFIQREAQVKSLAALVG